MEHEHGGFKVIRWIWRGAVKRWPEIRWFHGGGISPPPSQRQNLLPEN
jgi:hypothetical protein